MSRQVEKFNYLEFLSTECKTEIATADFVSQLMMNKVYEKGFKDACMSSQVIPMSVLEDIKSEIKQWYWDADTQSLAKDPCVVDAMVDLFIRTINKHMSGKSEIENENGR